MNNQSLAVPSLQALAFRFRLVVTDGPAAGQSCESSQPLTLVGSRRDCDFSMPHSDISQVHCAILSDGRRLECVDLCSRNGVHLNDQKIASAALRPGETLRIGPNTVRVEDPGGFFSAADAVPLPHPPVVLYDGERKITLASLPSVIGRRHSCGVILDTPDISLAHALLFWMGTTLVLADLGSRSGSFVNNRRVVMAPLAAGDELWIGGQRLRVAMSEAPRLGPADASVVATSAATPAWRQFGAVDLVPEPPRAIATASALKAAEPAGELTSVAIGKQVADVIETLREFETRLSRQERELTALRERLDQQKSQQALLQIGLETREREVQQRERELSAAQKSCGGAGKGLCSHVNLPPANMAWFSAPPPTAPLS
jgi:pSer/pThr/pTyr-binding forkhead associated (FHA) protein